MRSFLWAAGGTLFPFVMTALGAALVFLLRGRVSARADRLCMGFAAGVMSAAAVFSLLLPAMEQAAARGDSPAAAVIPGFALGMGLMLALEMLLERKSALSGEAQRRRLLLFSAVTLHNIPEGMAVGLSFALAARGSAAALAAALALAFGIGIQNFPEGAAISLPLRQGGMSRRRSFAYGALSGAAEPAAGALCALFAAAVTPAMPLLMAFAAGAMMWVVMAQMLPAAASQRDGAAAASGGYLLMMALDVLLG